ncbi:MAG: hypothetical protein ACYS47_20315, partial [Planctomycetota bacterium]
MRRRLPILVVLLVLLALIVLYHLGDGEEPFIVPPAPAPGETTVKVAEPSLDELTPLERADPPRRAQPAKWKKPPKWTRGSRSDAGDRQSVSGGRDPKTEETKFGAAETIHLTCQYGVVPEPRPLPEAFDSPYFWPRVDLDMGVSDEGKPLHYHRLAFPMVEPLYLVWDGAAVKIAPQETDFGGQTLILDPTLRRPNRVLVSYAQRGSSRFREEPYEFFAQRLGRVEINGVVRDMGREPFPLRLRLRSNTYRVGKFHGTRITVCDENVNGVFNDGWGGTGRRISRRRRGPERGGHDSIVVGSGRSARSTLFGRMLQVGERYFEITHADAAGTLLKVREYKGPMGTLLLNYNFAPAVRPLHLVMETDAFDSGTGFVNLGGRIGSVDVPVGSYAVKWGLLCYTGDPEKGPRVELLRGRHKRFDVEEEEV